MVARKMRLLINIHDLVSNPLTTHIFYGIEDLSRQSRCKESQLDLVPKTETAIHQEMLTQQLLTLC